MKTITTIYFNKAENLFHSSHLTFKHVHCDIEKGFVIATNGEDISYTFPTTSIFCIESREIPE